MAAIVADQMKRLEHTLLGKLPNAIRGEWAGRISSPPGPILIQYRIGSIDCTTERLAGTACCTAATSRSDVTVAAIGGELNNPRTTSARTQVP